MEKFELWHNDDHFESDPRQKRQNGRVRLTKQYVAALRRSPSSLAHALAEKLKACGSGSRCRSGACPQCGRAYARWLAQTAATAIGKGEMIFVTIIPPIEKPARHLSTV